MATNKSEEVRALVNRILAALDHAEEVPYEALIAIGVALDRAIQLTEMLQVEDISPDGPSKSAEEGLSSAADDLIDIFTSLIAWLPASSQSAPWCHLPKDMTGSQWPEMRNAWISHRS